MYKIEITEYGLYVTMGGKYEPGEMKRYTEEKAALISAIDAPFSIIVDLRNAYPPDPDDAELLIESQAQMKATKLQRVAIILQSPVLSLRAKQILNSADTYNITRIIDSSKSCNWMELAIGWAVDSIEPEHSSSLIKNVRS